MPIDLPMTFLRQDIANALAADAADDREDTAMEKAELARQEAEAAHAAEVAAEELASEYAGMEPPNYSVGTDEADDIPPMRRRLVNYVAWLADLDAQLSTLTAGREQYLASLGIPSMTKRAIAELIASDKSGLVALMASGGDLTKHQTRAAERKKLEAKLSDDEHNREIAVAAIGDVDKKLDQLTVQISALRARHNEFVADCLREHLLATAAASMIEKADILREAALVTLGAFGALQTLKGISHQARPHQIILPTPRLAGDAWHTASEGRPGYSTSGAGYVLDFPAHEQERVRREWMSKAARLRDDPLADLEDKS